MSKYTINEIKDLIAMGFTPEQIARMSGEAPAKGKKPTGKAAPKGKAQPKADKPQTRTEAIAKWKAEHGITPEKTAAYKAMYEAKWEADWAAWTSSDEYKAIKGSRKEANRAKAKAIRNGYRAACGLPAEK